MITVYKDYTFFYKIYNPSFIKSKGRFSLNGEYCMLLIYVLTLTIARLNPKGWEASVGGCYGLNLTELHYASPREVLALLQ